MTSQTNKYQVRDVTDTYLPLLNNDFILGDVNGDGIVGISDVTDLVDYILGDVQSGFVIEAADVSGDGIVGIADVTDLIDKILTSA